jgi:N-acetylmuramoyl-L-alanine amidase
MAMATPEPPPVPKPAETKQPVGESTKSRETPKAPRTTKSGPRSLSRALGLKIGRVVLDPGHGGNDHGTTGPSGLTEKELVLDVAMRLGALIEQRMGSEVVYTRTADTYVGLEERTALANERRADLFLSIHANSSPLRGISGAEVYYLNLTTSREAMDVAARENAGHGKSIFELREMIQKIALTDKLDESKEFATRLQAALSSAWSRMNASAKNRGVKKAPFVVLIGAAMPSVLAEIGFLSNARDEALMRKPDQRQRMAEALYKGIEQYVSGIGQVQAAQSRPESETGDQSGR